VPDAKDTDTEPVHAAGVICRSKAGRVLLCRRIDTGEWSWPGGVLEDGETLEECAFREFHEECGYRLGSVGAQLMRRVRDGVDYVTYLCDVPDEFPVRLNAEHSAWAWLDPACVLEDVGGSASREAQT
jgi:8-oxo-dGTP pyrophosphatase MutT (NUDIX family)